MATPIVDHSAEHALASSGYRDVPLQISAPFEGAIAHGFLKETCEYESRPEFTLRCGVSGVTDSPIINVYAAGMANATSCWGCKRRQCQQLMAIKRPGQLKNEMSDVTKILSKIADGESAASEDLLPLVYEELRRLATFRMSNERPGQTLQPTALVHEAYIRLVGSAEGDSWNNRAHFFAAAAESMRRILVDNARRKGRQIHGGRMKRLDLDQIDSVSVPVKSDEIVMVDGSLAKLESVSPQAAMLVKLRYFAGFTNKEAAEMLGISPRKATQIWTYARSWLLADIEKQT